MKILVNCDVNLFEAKRDVTALKQIEFMQKLHPDIMYVGNGCKNTNFEEAMINFKPDVVFFAADFKYNQIRWSKNIRCVKVACYQDFWDELEIRCKILQDNNIHGLITKNYIPEKYSLLAKNIIHKVNPSGCDEEIFKPIYTEKKYDILMSGYTWRERYPARHRLFNIINSISHKIKVHYRCHKGYHYKDPKEKRNEQEKYNAEINLAKFALAGTALDENLHMQKTWEIPATSAICITDGNDNEPDAEKIKKHSIVLDLNSTDKQISDRILSMVKNYDSSFSKKANSIVESYASLSHRTQQLLDSIYSIYEESSRFI